MLHPSCARLRTAKTRVRVSRCMLPLSKWRLQHVSHGPLSCVHSSYVYSSDNGSCHRGRSSCWALASAQTIGSNTTTHQSPRHICARCHWLQHPPPPRCRYARSAPWQWPWGRNAESSPVCTQLCFNSPGCSICESSTKRSTPHPIRYAADAVKAPMMRISSPESHQDFVV